ncbi:MAG: right-handed parallel beta-helix repeat-containing protein [Spirochaetia bacterium]
MPIDESLYTKVYYVDHVNGNDGNVGSREFPWKSLSAVNSHFFKAGEAVLFRRSGVWKGALVLSGGGSRDRPVYVGSYGRGEKPVIQADNSNTAVYLKDSSGWVLRNLEVSNSSSLETSNYGILIHAAEKNVSNISIDHCRIDGVNNGDPDNPDHSTAGIGFLARSEFVKSRFTDVRIYENEIENIKGAGILFTSVWNRWRGEEYSYPSENAVFTGNKIKNTSSSGISISALDDGLILDNTITDVCGMESIFSSGGITLFDSRNTVIRRNTVHGIQDTQSPAVLLDYFSYNTIIEQNFSLMNHGGFCSLAGSASDGVYNRRTQIRYNVAVPASNAVFRTLGPVKEVSVYNNTLYLKEKNQKIVKGTAESFRFFNNLVISEYLTKTEIMENDFLMNPAEAAAAGVSGPFDGISPDRRTAYVFRPERNSLLIDQGTTPAIDEDMRDFTGNPAGVAGVFDIGAFEYQESIK